MAKTERVLVSMPVAFLAQVDEMAEKEERARSELIREALRHYKRTFYPDLNPKIENTETGPETETN